MANFFSSYKLNMLCIPITLIAFTANCIAYPSFGHANNYECGFINTALSLARIKKLVDKLQKLENKNDKLSKVIDILVEIKHEIEIATNKKMSLDDSLKKVQSDISARGGYIPDNVINSFKKQVKKKEKKVNHHASYLAYVFSNPFMEYSEEEELALFEAKHAGKEPETDINVPVDVAIGITISLCGVFLMTCSSIIPGAFIYGEKLIEIGGVMALTAGAQHYMKENP